MPATEGYASLLAAVAKGVTGDPGSAAGRATSAEFDRLAKERYKRHGLGYQRPLPEGDSVHRTRRTLDGRATSVDIAGGASTAADLAGEYVARQRLLTALNENKRDRALREDPDYTEAQKKARRRAKREGREPTAVDVAEALAKLHRKRRGPE